MYDDVPFFTPSVRTSVRHIFDPRQKKHAQRAIPLVFKKERNIYPSNSGPVAGPVVRGVGLG